MGTLEPRLLVTESTINPSDTLPSPHVLITMPNFVALVQSV